MSQYLDKVYEWQYVEPTDPTILLRDTQLVRQLGGGAGVISPGLDLTKPEVGLANALLGDPNARLPNRDSTTGFYPIPLIMEGGTRKSVREHINDVVAKGHPLTIKTNTFVTKVDFDTSGSVPKATGVQYLEGSHLYRASPLSGGAGTPGSVKATKEVILAGGVYVSCHPLPRFHILMMIAEHCSDAEALWHWSQSRACFLQYSRSC
jgi:choline dehydrogenase